jgi:hypothetical protein
MKEWVSEKGTEATVARTSSSITRAITIPTSIITDPRIEMYLLCNVSVCVYIYMCVCVYIYLERERERERERVNA